MFGRQKIAMVVAEFLGTFTLASVVLAILTGDTPIPFFVALAAGSTLALMTLVFGAFSGAHINPAVTLGLWSVRKVETNVAVVYVAAQMLGGLVALRFTEYMLNTSLKNIAGDKFDWRILIAEAVGTFVFTLGVSAALYQGYKGLRQAFTVGTSLALGILVAALVSNSILNPAVALSINSWSMAYVVGPIVGGIVGVNLYALLFAPRVVRAKRAVVTASSTKSKKPSKKTARRKK